MNNPFKQSINFFGNSTNSKDKSDILGAEDHPAEDISSSHYPRQTSTSAKALMTKVARFTKSNIHTIGSFSLALLMILFFLVITRQSLFESIGFYRTRWATLIITILSLVLSYVCSFWNNAINNKIQSYSVFAHSIILTLFSYAYLIRLNENSLEIFGFNFTTSIVFVPLSLLVFLVNYNAFSGAKHAQLLTVAQTLFILLFSYSIIGFINVDNTFARNLSQGWLSVIFNWPAWIWLIISSVAITFVSIRNVANTNFERKLYYIGGYYLLTLQLLLAVYILNFSYWYQTLLALISWNFVYTNILGLMTKKSDPKYKPRLTISIVYHFVLFIFVLLYAR